MARSKLGGGKTERLQLVITDTEVAAIEDWRFANRVPSRSEAIRRLVQIGLHTNTIADTVGLSAIEFINSASEVEHKHMSSRTTKKDLVTWYDRNMPSILSVATLTIGLMQVVGALRSGLPLTDAIKRAENNSKIFDTIASRRWLAEGEQE